jgi:hypothetical protein
MRRWREGAVPAVDFSLSRFQPGRSMFHGGKELQQMATESHRVAGPPNGIRLRIASSLLKRTYEVNLGTSLPEIGLVVVVAIQ